VHVTGGSGNEASFLSYLFVTHIVDGAVANLSTGLCSGVVRDEDAALRLAELAVVLDTRTSEVLAARPVV
jgi:hypothetical protein